jgi:hypothetical protein
MSLRIKALVFGVVAFLAYLLLFPIQLTAIDAALLYAHLATFPAVSEVLGLAPFLLLITGLGSSGFMVFGGLTNRISGAIDIMRLVWSTVISFMFFTLFPLMLGGLYTIWLAMNGTHTGAEVVPIFGIVILASALGGSGVLAVEGATGRRVFRSGKKGGKKGKRN